MAEGSRPVEIRLPAIRVLWGKFMKVWALIGETRNGLRAVRVDAAKPVVYVVALVRGSQREVVGIKGKLREARALAESLNGLGECRPVVSRISLDVPSPVLPVPGRPGRKSRSLQTTGGRVLPGRPRARIQT